MMSEAFERMTVGAIVATDFRAAAIFEQYGIDFCCGGGRPVGDACRVAAVAPSEIEAAIDALGPAAEGEADVSRWPLGRLIDHIVSVHHGYVRSSMPTIRQYLARLVEVHGTRHPELVRVLSFFDTIVRDLSQHLVKEERVLFPFVRELETHVAAGGLVCSPFGTVRNPIRMLQREHRDAAEELGAIRELTQGYAAPDDGCATYRVCMAELQRFERDLHRHVHLENNVLFPKAIALEGGDEDAV
jgi:regulator of cell morphogenesis and NO signaling